MPGTRDGAIQRALADFDSRFEARLAGLVAIPSTSQDPGHNADLARYLHHGIAPWLRRMGFTTEILPTRMGAPARSCWRSGWRRSAPRSSPTATATRCAAWRTSGGPGWTPGP